MADAHALYKAGEGRWGTNEDTFIHILATRSAAHLTTVSQYYLQAFGHSLEKAIQKETSGHFENALLAVVQATCFPPRYFAHVFTPCTHLGVLDCHWGLNTFQQNKRHAGFGFKSHCE
jgi:hypothetical protein